MIQKYLWKKVKEKFFKNEDRKESEKKIEQYDNEEDNEEIPISK